MHPPPTLLERLARVFESGSGVFSERKFHVNAWAGEVAFWWAVLESLARGARYDLEDGDDLEVTARTSQLYAD